ncbi:MAG: DUF262 domain-containing protein [Rhodobiaceae bacterium]|nr:DUF262 domain-containing protein [Rhodobiaceae bacterium]
MIRYQVRSRELIDLVNDVRDGRLIISPYFQRNLVWRDTHKRDFIETILLGLPFPQIFIARGTIDVDTMKATSCVVDGQQRMNAIMEFVGDELIVDNRRFNDLAPADKEEILKYQVAVIDLDMTDDDPNLQEVFKRLNRTFYALSTIEKFSTEYASSEFMLVAKLLSQELIKEDLEDETNLGSDPNITEDFRDWASSQKIGAYPELLLSGVVFTPHETARMVHLMFTLNLMATFLKGYYARNGTAKELLDEQADECPQKDEIVIRFEQVAKFLKSMRLQKASMWNNKANLFTLFTELGRNFEQVTEIGADEVKKRLNDFEKDVPSDYALAAREAVNNRKERLERSKYLKGALGI